jgi:hypothetical protein
MFGTFQYIDCLVYQKTYIESALKIVQPPVAIAPLPRMGARTPALFPFKDEWPGQIHNYQKVDALARQWEHLLMLADQTQTSEDQIKLVRRQIFRVCVCQRCTFL